MAKARLVPRVGRNYAWTSGAVRIGDGPAMVEIAPPSSDGASGGRFVVVSQIKLHLGSTTGRVKLPNRHIIFQRTNPDRSDASAPTDQLVPSKGLKQITIANDFDPYEETSELDSLHETGLRITLDGVGKRELQWMYISFRRVRA